MFETGQDRWGQLLLLLYEEHEKNYAGCSFNIGLECLKKQMTPSGKKKEEDVIFQTRKREMGNKEK